MPAAGAHGKEEVGAVEPPEGVGPAQEEEEAKTGDHDTDGQQSTGAYAVDDEADHRRQARGLGALQSEGHGALGAAPAELLQDLCKEDRGAPPDGPSDVEDKNAEC